MSEWISVEDRLPPIETPVLCANSYEGMAVGVYDGTGWDLNCELWSIEYVSYGGGGYAVMDDDIAYWMPLPEPPKENKV